MRVGKSGHLSYCSNIHPAETWEETFKNLELYLIGVKQEVCKDQPFGIGLRLSNRAALELSDKKTLESFKIWLRQNNLYVFTLNGFPFGNFHGEVIKDKVHLPDWTTDLRKDYTLLLFDILAKLTEEGGTSGISTSPLTYRYWHSSEQELEEVKTKACKQLIAVVHHLMQIKKNSGKNMHLDIEPEPDGLLENSEEYVAFFKDYLLDQGTIFLQKKSNCSLKEAKDAIREHIQLCWDVCHFSIAYERPSSILAELKKENLKVGKIQISAALKCRLTEDNNMDQLQSYLRPFDEANYLHQAVIQTNGNNFLKFPDLNKAIAAMDTMETEGSTGFKELRTHYHVPVFLAEYQNLQSTQDDIIETLDLWKQEEFTDHLEIETYTWEVLPDQMQTDITTAITREINWVKQEIGKLK